MLMSRNVHEKTYFKTDKKSTKKSTSKNLIGLKGIVVYSLHRLMLQVSSQAGWGIVWVAAPRPPWATGARNTAEAEGPVMVEPGAAGGKRRMTPRAWRTCPGGFYPRGRASWTSSAVNSWADTHPLTTTTISSSSSSRLVMPAIVR